MWFLKWVLALVTGCMKLGLAVIDRTYFLPLTMDQLFWIQGIMYGSVGFGCGLIGQGIANLIMTAKR